MGRLLAIDYGLKRTGLAISDPLKIIATGLTVVESEKLFSFLQEYNRKEQIERFIVGIPRRHGNKPSEMLDAAHAVVEKLKSVFPEIPVSEIDESFSTIRAREAMIAGGMKRSDREKKGSADLITATMLLQEYMALSKS